MSTKDYKICEVLGGVIVTRVMSLNARSFFSSTIDDVELIREVVTEAAFYGGIVNGFSNLQALNKSLDWKARGLPEGTTTIEADLGYVDDRVNRRIDRQVGLSNAPLVGSKQNDMVYVDSLSVLLPWIVDRRAKENNWWKNHQNGRSEGSKKDPFVFDRLYAAGWIVTWGEASTYYPPLTVYRVPYTQGDVLGAQADSHDTPYVTANIPQNNPLREATFTKPYPDDVVLGLSLLSAVAPVYFTGMFQGIMYNDTFMGSVGVDIKIVAISTLLDALHNSMTQGSFGLIVDLNFSPIVISQAVVSKLYPALTGFEDDRVTYDPDGNIVQDRRNQSYLPSDTILQDLTKLTNANWTDLMQSVHGITPGNGDYRKFNITITGDSTSTEFYVWFERWKYVADWAMLVMAPVVDVEHAVDIRITNNGAREQNSSSLQGERGVVIDGEAEISNRGSLDVILKPRTAPTWVQLKMARNVSLTLKSGETTVVNYQVLTESLEIGTQVSAIVFDVRDADYPNCFFSEQMQLPVSVKILQKDCGVSKLADASGTCVCDSNSVEMLDSCVSNGVLVALILVPVLICVVVGMYVHSRWRRRRADAVWKVKSSELMFGNPVEVIGEGSFGRVLLAEYRGTQVAVKKVLGKTGKSRFVSASRKKSVAKFNGEVDVMENGASSAFLVATSKDGGDSTSESNQEETLEAGRSLSHGSSESASGEKSRYGIATTSSVFMRSKNRQSSRRAAFIEEMRLISKLRHPCIITVMGAVVEPNSEPMLVMEYMEHGSLYNILNNSTMEFDGEIVLSILRDISQGIQFLHNTIPPLVHGDLKTANILVDIRFRAKVSDFGLSGSRRSSGVATGNPYWMAPELLNGNSTNATSSDVYSFGIMLYEIYARKNPYEGEVRLEVLRGVCDPSVNKRPPVPPNMPGGVASLMHDCLLFKPDERPTMDEITKRVRRFEIVDVEPVGATKAGKLGERNFDVLLKVFPRHIAEALRDGRKIEPEHHELVTIFFSDIVGFTTISSELPPQKVSDMLHRVFFRFDGLAEAHEIFKVETIGDAWMGVTNCVKDQSTDHVKRIALFALDAVCAANETLVDEEDLSRGYVQIRVGFHTGPVLSNVIGSHNPHYSLFGDTVNTASRMESNSKPGRIHCSERAALLLHEQAPEVALSCRGEIKIKGKGSMTTYWVNNGLTEESNSTDLLVTDSSKEPRTTSSRRVQLAPLYEYIETQQA